MVIDLSVGACAHTDIYGQGSNRISGHYDREGYMSCTGECFDIGMTVQAALRSFENARQPYCGSTDPMSAGNGSLMRLAPVPLFYAKHPALAIEKAGESSRTTHGAKEAVDACRYFAALIVGAVGGKSREEILDSSYPDRKLWAVDPLAPRIAKNRSRIIQAQRI